jgi:hypothetical protein
LAHPAIAILSLIVVGVMNKVSLRSSSSLRSSPLIYGTSNKVQFAGLAGGGMVRSHAFVGSTRRRWQCGPHTTAVRSRAAGRACMLPLSTAKTVGDGAAARAFSGLAEALPINARIFSQETARGEAATAQEARRVLTEAEQRDTPQLRGSTQDVTGPWTGRTRLPAPRRTAPPAASHPSIVRRPISIIKIRL